MKPTQHPRSLQTQRRIRLLAAAVVGCCGISGAYAQTQVSWTGTTGNYVDGSNWSSTATPSNAANEFLMINNGGTANVSGADAAQGNFLTLGATAGDTGNLQISGGTMTLGELRIGGNESLPGSTTVSNMVATGSVTQSGGFVSVTDASQTGPIQSLYLGDGGSQVQGNSANGSYTITAGDLLSGTATDDAIVVGTGSLSVGSFVQQGGNVTSTGFVIVGRRGATATYNMSGGTLNVGQGTALSNMILSVGDGANADATAPVPGTNATFTQTNGTVTVKSGVEIGRRGGTGTYTISGGTLNVGAELRVGTNGGSSTAALFGGTGTLNVGGSAVVNIGTNFHLSLSNNATANTANGSLVMTGGQINMTNTGAIWAVGNGLSSTGDADISGGTITQPLVSGSPTTPTIEIGRNNGTGKVRIRGTANVNLNRLLLSSDNPTIPQKRELIVEGGQLTVGFWEQGGGSTASTRTVTVTGTGSLNVTSTAAAHRGGKLVTYNFSGGTASFAGNMPMDTSTLNINGGSVTFNTLRLQSATMNTSSGSLLATTVNDNSSNQGGQVTLNGGTTTATNWTVQNAAPPQAGLLTVNGGTFNVTTMSVQQNGTPTQPALLDLLGGNVTFGTLNTGPGTIGTVHIAGGALNLSVTQLNLNSGTTLRTDNTVSLGTGTGIALGNGTINTSTGSLTLLGAITVPSGGRTLTKTGTGTLTLGGAWTGTAGAINVAAGTLNLDTALTPTNAININASSTTVFRAAGITRAAAVNVSNGTTATIQTNGQRVLSANSFGVTGGAKLDIQDNHLIAKTQSAGTWNGSAYTDLTGLIATGRNGNMWNGSGIVTSQTQAIGGNLTSIGIATASDVRPNTGSETALWAGQTITGSDVLVMYTYGGDATLDGKINIDDYVKIDSGIAGAYTGWSNGDFNYDGKVSIDDYITVIDANIGNQNGTFYAAGGVDGGGLSGVTAVPEPVGMGFLGGIATLLIRRKRRK
jgi:hypothetical protein